MEKVVGQVALGDRGEREGFVGRGSLALVEERRDVIGVDVRV